MGKTHEALGITFLYLLELGRIKNPRVLIVVPPNLREGKWLEELTEPDRFQNCIRGTDDSKVKTLARKFKDSVYVLKNKYLTLQMQ